LARDPDLRIRLGTAARRRVREQFDWDKKGIFMTKLYETLCTKEAAVEAQAPVKRSVDGFSHAN
jgi:hypothetical protein